MNYFPQAIEICSTEQDWKKIVVALAKRHPKAVVEAAFNNSWIPRARELYIDNGSKIEAIKHCRNMTGMGLKEAKEAVESLG